MSSHSPAAPSHHGSASCAIVHNTRVLFPSSGKTYVVLVVFYGTSCTVCKAIPVCMDVKAARLLLGASRPVLDHVSQKVVLLL